MLRCNRALPSSTTLDLLCINHQTCVLPKRLPRAVCVNTDAQTALESARFSFMGQNSIASVSERRQSPFTPARWLLLKNREDANGYSRCLSGDMVLPAPFSLLISRPKDTRRRSLTVSLQDSCTRWPWLSTCIWVSQAGSTISLGDLRNS